MKRLLLPLLAALALPTAISANTVTKISDFDLISKEGEKFDFVCPKEKYEEKDDGITRIRSRKLYEECWFQLNNDHINIMDMQRIKREDIIDFFSVTESRLEYTRHIFLYKLNSDVKRFVIRPKMKSLWAFNVMNDEMKMLEAISFWLNK